MKLHCSPQILIQILEDEIPKGVIQSIDQLLGGRLRCTRVIFSNPVDYRPATEYTIRLGSFSNSNVLENFMEFVGVIFHEPEPPLTLARIVFPETIVSFRELRSL